MAAKFRPIQFEAPFPLTPVTHPFAQPTPYLAPTPEQTPAGQDATMDFQAALNDPTRWLIKSGVPIFKAHERKDPTTGQMIRVDLPKLYRIANNMSQLERGGVPVRITLGHTEPTKMEAEQPPVGGYYRNPRVQPFGPKGEPAVVVDEWLDPQYAGVRKNFPYRSAEYYDDAEQITGVALLTRDPFLDLGVVAYGKGERPSYYAGQLLGCTSSIPGPVRYALNPATGRAPVMYRLTLGELPMYPPGYTPPVAAPQPQPQPQPAPPQPQPMPQYAVPPQFVPPQPPTTQYALPQPGPNYAQAPIPTQYGQPPAPYQGPWPGPAHRPPSMHREHNQQWSYQAGGRRPAPYATEPPSVSGDMGAGGPPPGGGGMGGNPIEALYSCLTEAVSVLQSMMEGASQAPQEPFPPGGMDGNPMTPASRYGARPGGYRPRPQPRQAPQRGYARYERGGPAPTQTTISGLPVGYQLKLDQQQYQLDQANQAIRVLMYERDAADTNECVAEIRNLAARGYDVGDYEIQELKKQPRERRAEYLQHISTKYNRVPTEMPPTMMGDPTPGPNDAAPQRPLSKDEMEQALAMAAQNPGDRNAYTNAIRYMRGEAGPTQYAAQPAVGPDGLPMYDGPQRPFGNPYPEPSANGHY